MNALGKFRDLFVGESSEVAPPSAQNEGVLTAPDNPEQAARVEAERCKAVADDLQARLDAAAAAIPGLEERRATLARSLAVDGGNEADFAAACNELDAGHARHEALGQLLGEAEAARREAQLALNAAQAPRLAAERRQRVEAATEAARKAREAFIQAYAEASRALAAFADELDRLAYTDPSAAAVLGASVRTYQDDPMRRLETAGWRPRSWSSFTALEYRLVAFVPPQGQ